MRTAEFRWGSPRHGYGVGDSIRWGGDDYGKPGARTVFVNVYSLGTCADCGSDKGDFVIRIEKNVIRTVESDWLRDHVAVDFQKTDDFGRLRMTTGATAQSLRDLGIVLAEGLPLKIRDRDAAVDWSRDDLVAEAVVRRNEDTGEWVLEVDAATIQHESDRDDWPGVRGCDA